MKVCKRILLGVFVATLYLVTFPSYARAQELLPLRAPRAVKERLSDAPSRIQTSLRFRLDPTQSRFMVRTFSGGLLWFKGHDHFVAVREFTGEAQLTPGAISPAALQFTVRADSLTETRDVFAEKQKQIINGEIRDLVLETGKYPEIVFRSTSVSGKMGKDGYEAKIAGELTLHGVTRHIVIPAFVTLSDTNLRARGEFVVKRSDYKVNATSALHNTIRVRDKLKLTFEIVARQ